jgi:hypothetical protein
MYFSKLFTSLAIASMVIAAPANGKPKNQIAGLPRKSIRCGARHPREQLFTAGQIKTAAETALDLVDAGKQIGK